MTDEHPLGPFCPTCGAMHCDWIQERAAGGRSIPDEIARLTRERDEARAALRDLTEACPDDLTDSTSVVWQRAYAAIGDEQKATTNDG